MKDKLILNDQTEIQIESGSALSDIKVLSQTKSDMIAVWDKLTAENLVSVQIKNAGGVSVGNYANLILNSETSVEQRDGTIFTSFRLREKTEVELLREEVDALKEGQEVQNGAIDDLGAITSALAEAQEGGIDG